MVRKLSRQEAKDVLLGCAILGTGGGGSLITGCRTVDEDYGAGLCYELIPLEETEDDGYYTSPYNCGSISDVDESDPFFSYPMEAKRPTVNAVKALEVFTGIAMSGVVSIEYGGGNTAQAFTTGAHMGIPTVDADAAGRAVPELQFSTFYVKEQPISPLSVATVIGETAVFNHIPDDARAEALVRSLSVVSGKTVSMSDHLITGKNLKFSVIPDALSYAEKVGRASRMAQEAGEDPVAAIVKAGDGWRLFDGIVSEDCSWYDEGGFTCGTIEIDGIGNDEGNHFKVWFKNENMILWKNGEPWIVCPDMICLVETGDANPVLNPRWYKGMAVSGLGFRCHEMWRSERGLGILNPGFFGFDYNWTPIEEVLA